MFKIPNGEILYVQYSKQDSDIITHIICKKNFVEANKTWILYSVSDGKLTKIKQGADPTKLEKEIDYLYT